MSDIDQTKIRQMDGSLLLVMQGLLRHRRTTLVAAQLGLSQSAISHALARLRIMFGDPLFIRRPHGLEPTRHALELSPRIDALIAATREALGLSAAFDPATSTRGFRLGSPDFVANLLAPPLLTAFGRQAPNARFAFSLTLGDEALRSLRLDAIDLALGRFARPSDGVQLIPLFADDYVLVARAGHPRLKGPVTRDLFQTLAHVTVSVAGDFRTFTEQDFADLRLTRHVVAAVPRFTIAFAMVSGGDAVCVAPRRLAQGYAQVHGLALHDLPHPLPPIQVVAARRATPDLAVDWLLEVIRDALATEP